MSQSNNTVSLSIEQLRDIFSDQLWIAISSEDIEKATKELDVYSSNRSRQRGLINYLCMQKLIPLIKNYSDREVKAYLPQDSAERMACFWDVVNGFSLDVEGGYKLVVVPSEYSDIEEFSIPQEWMDIFTLHGEYYLGVQVDLEEGWLRVWGYATHQEIKQQGEYTSASRSYSLDEGDVTTDVNLLWAAMDLGIKEVVNLNPIPDLSKEQTKELIEQLSEPSLFDIRHDLEFEQWAGIIKNEDLRQKLYEARTNCLAPVPASLTFSQSVSDIVATLSSLIDYGTALLGWSLSPAYASRGQFSFRSTYRSSSFQQVQVIIELLDYKTPTGELQQAIIDLDNIDTDDEKIRELVIANLAKLINELERDEETRWRAADKLYEIDPTHPSAGVQQRKGISFDERFISFKMDIIALPDDKFAIRASVESDDPQNVLPGGLEMIIFDRDSRELLRISSKPNDYLIKKPLKGNKGDEFIISLKSSQYEIREQFKI
jgi:hypothetical protein